MVDKANSYSVLGEAADRIEVATPSTIVDIPARQEHHKSKNVTLTASCSQLYSEAHSGDVFQMALRTIGAAGVGIAISIFYLSLTFINTRPRKTCLSIL